MPRHTLVPLAAASLAALADASPVADRVWHLPGWDAPLLSNMYSGYISAGSEEGYDMHEHYLFFESEGDPKNDPLIMWTNGGPGAPSLFGSFTELGPYYITDASLQTAAYNATGIPSLFLNAFRWTKLGNLLIRNLPPPVGFSYCDPAGPAGDGNSCGTWNDTRTAKHSLTFMQGWVAAFPEFSGRDLYLAGESYAGIYVPMLAREILQAGGALAEQLKGFAVGDGCIGGGCLPNKGPYFLVEFFHGHGQFSDKTYAEIQRVCPRSELMDGVSTPACKEVLDRMDQERGYSFQYNLYDECYDFNVGLPKKWHERQTWWGPPRPRERRLHAATPPRRAHASGSVGAEEPWHMDGSPCGGTATLPHWVNTPAVRAALHVPQNAVYFSADGGPSFDYKSTEPSLVPWYQNIVASNRLRILIYNGDTDPYLNTFVAQNWTATVGTEVEPWRPWTHDGHIRMGGFVTRYANNFDFLTIRGAGHMVPEYKPEAAHVMMASFLSNSDFPRYTPERASQGSHGSAPEEIVV